MNDGGSDGGMFENELWRFFHFSYGEIKKMK